MDVAAGARKYILQRLTPALALVTIVSIKVAVHLGQEETLLPDFPLSLIAPEACRVAMSVVEQSPAVADRQIGLQQR